MKKFISILLALTLVLSLGVVAFAEGVAQDTAPVVPKKYQVNNGTAPAETFTFKFEGVSYVNGDGTTVVDATIPEIANVTISYDAISTTTEKTVSASVDANDYELGVYTYKVTELGGNTAGVTYSDEELYLVLTVLRDEDDGKHYFAAMHYESATGTDKTTGFTNEYDSGSLSVTKNITGNMADMDKEFAFTITFTGPAGKVVNSAITVEKPDGTTEVKNFVENALTYTINLGNEDTVKFTNLPTGVTYTVSENNENYTQKDETYSDSTKTIGANDNDTYTITNELTTTVDTGISVDSIPYIVLALVSVIGLAVFFSKKRVIE